MTENKKYTSVGVSSDTLDKLSYIAEVTGMSKLKLLQFWVDSFFEIGANFERLCIDVDSSVINSQVLFTLSGKSKLKMQTRTEVLGND